MAQSVWTWRRALALALCLLVFALGVRPQPVEVRSGDVSTISAMGPQDGSGTSSEPDGGPAQHCAHCGCGVMSTECSPAPRLFASRAEVRFTFGARGGPDVISLLNPRPPRS